MIDSDQAGSGHQRLMAKKNPAKLALAGFKSILFGRLEETGRTISTVLLTVCFRFVMPDITQTNYRIATLSCGK